MSTSNWFDDVPVLGKMAPVEAVAKLREIGEGSVADALEGEEKTGYESQVMSTRDESPWSRVGKVLAPRAWQHTAHAFGYLAPAVPGRLWP